MDGLNWLDLDLTNSWLVAPILTNIQGIHPTKKFKIDIQKYDSYNFRCLNRLDSKSRCFYAYSHICRHMHLCIYIYTYFYLYRYYIQHTRPKVCVTQFFAPFLVLKKKARLQQQSFCVTLCSDLGRNAKKIPSCLSLDISSGWANPVIHHHEILFINMNKISGFVWMHLCFFDRRLVERWELDFPNLEWIAGNCFDSYSDILYVHWCYDWTYSRASYFAAMEHLCLVLFIFR